MSARRALAALAALVLTGCGGGSGDPQAERSPTPSRPDASVPSPPPRPSTSTPAPSTSLRPSVPAPPDEPPVARTAYVDALEAYCSTTVRAIERLAGSAENRRDPIAPVASFARRYRAGLEELARLTPPVTLRRVHLLTLAQGRESADRLDDGARLGSAGDIDAATTALGELPGLLPARLPRSVRRGAPACAQEVG